jgi:hypothetical protein
MEQHEIKGNAQVEFIAQSLTSIMDKLNEQDSIIGQLRESQSATNAKLNNGISSNLEKLVKKVDILHEFMIETKTVAKMEEKSHDEDHNKAMTKLGWKLGALLTGLMFLLQIAVDYLKSHLFVIAIPLIFMLTSCSRQRMQAIHCSKCPHSDSTYVHEVVTEVPHDSTIYFFGDTAITTVHIVCDTALVPHVVYKSVSGRKLHQDVILLDNSLTVRCIDNPDSLKLHWTNTVKTNLVQKIRSYQIPFKKPFTRWQLFQIWTGRVVWILLLILVLLIVFKAIFKSYFPESTALKFISKIL